ncbi:hypothetical protein C8J56DRAFT_1163529 [Mycena floridula]|nr:hypothetical protein C8J56DRAFT_1171457 [Mycena floridula]KAJ7585105.1 hypothetical protein C8J56DRAFT_1166281 [Mycena floridula]KAJ7591606.1 hypothetical protein C8J56DRAFT_1163529 [Mycena floridula]
MSFSKFRVDSQPVLLFNNGPQVSFPDGSSSSPNPYLHPGPPPDHRRFLFCQTNIPAPGSYEADIASGKFTHRWDSWLDFTNWLAQYQNSNCIEFRKVMHNNKSHHYADTIYYYCARRHGTGGKKQLPICSFCISP